LRVLLILLLTCSTAFAGMDFTGRSYKEEVMHGETAKLGSRPLSATLMTCMCVVSRDKMSHLLTTIGAGDTKEEYLERMLRQFEGEDDVTVILSTYQGKGDRIISKQEIVGYLKHRIGVEPYVHPIMLSKKFRIVTLDDTGYHIRDSDLGAGVRCSVRPLTEEEYKDHKK